MESNARFAALERVVDLDVSYKNLKSGSVTNRLFYTVKIFGLQFPA